MKAIMTTRRQQKCLSVRSSFNELETRETQGHKVPLNRQCFSYREKKVKCINEKI